MDRVPNPKITGAFIIGFALVFGTYVISNFGEPNLTPTTLYAVADEAPPRVFIPVTDENADGLEDWRDQFITAPAVTLNAVSDETPYEAPTTLTGQLGINLMEGLLSSVGAGPIGKPKDKVVTDAVERLGVIAQSDTIYDFNDVIVTTDPSDEAVRVYGNTLATILLTESDMSIPDELTLFENYLANPETADTTDLQKLASIYKNYRDRTLETPVPRLFLKQHLDLINVYNALHQNIDSMSKADTDPMLPYLRLQRYEDDVRGLAIALTNTYNSLVPYASAFKADDPALLFVNFSTEYQ